MSFFRSYIESNLFLCRSRLGCGVHSSRSLPNFWNNKSLMHVSLHRFMSIPYAIHLSGHTICIIIMVANLWLSLSISMLLIMVHCITLPAEFSLGFFMIPLAHWQGRRGNLCRMPTNPSQGWSEVVPLDNSRQVFCRQHPSTVNNYPGYPRLIQILGFAFNIF